MSDRTPRSQQTREAGKKVGKWSPANKLPDPLPQEGYSHRWVRTGTRGTSDSANVSTRMREGYEPVKAEDYPELKLMSDIGSRFQGNIEVGGLLLCKTATENVEARQEYYRDLNSQQIEGVDRQFMRENDPRMPMLKPERRSS
jgi:hypothetical protein